MTINSIARSVLESVLDRKGYVLKEKRLPPCGLRAFVHVLKSSGFVPRTIIDVGVGYGTAWLYEEFPDSRFELFEALDVFVPAMESICRRYNARYHVTALGAQEGMLQIDVNKETPSSSTMSGFSQERSPIVRSGKKVTIEPRNVSVRRLDEFGPFEPPVLLKVDVEGFEMAVLQGAAETLMQTEILIREISITKRHTHDISFGPFMSFVDSLGFSLIDIPELTPLGRSG